MDGTQKPQQQSIQDDRNTRVNSSTQGINSGSNGTSQPVQVPQSIPSGGKEQAPMPKTSSSEWIAPSTPEVNVAQELKEHGVEVQPVAPILPNDVKQAGVTVAKDATPVSISEDEQITINTSPSVLARVKQTHNNMKDAVRWLVELVGLAQRKRDREIEKGGKE